MKIHFFLLFTLICFGCNYEYEMNDDPADFKPQVVVNSIINPDEPVTAVLFWSRHYTEKGDFKQVKNFDAELYEDDALVAQERDADSVFTTSIYPKIGKKYRLKITVPNYGEVTAQTHIPTPADADATYITSKGGGYRTYQHVRVDAITAVDKSRAVWLRCFGVYKNEEGEKEKEKEKEKEEECSNLYSNSPFPDQVNAVLDSDDATYRGSNVGFEHFIRVPYQNLGMIAPLDFSVWLSNNISVSTDRENPPLDETGAPIWYVYYKLNVVRVDVITPSDDYDKYTKTRYKQSLYDYQPDLPFVSEIVPVYSNVQNGLGIFAGYSKKAIHLKPTTNE